MCQTERQQKILQTEGIGATMGGGGALGPLHPQKNRLKTEKKKFNIYRITIIT
jgi:hypothetical protein